MIDARIFLGTFLVMALALGGPARLAAQDVPEESPAEVEELADEPPAVGEDGSNLWWVPGILGFVAAAASFGGWLNAKQAVQQLRDERTRAERCSFDDDMAACESLGPFGRALISARTMDSVCTPETAEELGITAICDEANRDRRRRNTYFAVGVIGGLVGIASFIVYAVLERRDGEPEATAARIRPWLSLGTDRSAGLALDLRF